MLDIRAVVFVTMLCSVFDNCLYFWSFRS